MVWVGLLFYGDAVADLAHAILTHGRVATLWWSFGEALVRIRQMLQPEILAIIITGKTLMEPLRELGEVGCSVLHKPVTPTTVKGTMRAAWVA